MPRRNQIYIMHAFVAQCKNCVGKFRFSKKLTPSVFTYRRILAIYASEITPRKKHGPASARTAYNGFLSVMHHDFGYFQSVSAAAESADFISVGAASSRTQKASFHKPIINFFMPLCQ